MSGEPGHRLVCSRQRGPGRPDRAGPFGHARSDRLNAHRPAGCQVPGLPDGDLLVLTRSIAFTVPVFDPVSVNQDRPGSDPDRILVAQLTGTAGRHARWRELTGAEEAAAVAELRELAAGRGDLLAEVAGVLQGAAEGEPGEPLKRQAADLCRKAGADPQAIPAWILVGRARRAAASRPPFSRGLRP
jgi:hypothetical protein